MSMEAHAVATTPVEQLAELLVGPSGVDISCLTLSEANRLADGCDDLVERLRVHIKSLEALSQLLVCYITSDATFERDQNALGPAEDYDFSAQPG